MENSLPSSCSIAFKEWSGVCQALAAGRQSLIFRKGGIAEEAGRFVPEHQAFWLYPTHLHEAQQGLRELLPPIAEAAARPAGIVPISLFAEVVAVSFVDRLPVLAELEDLHVWTAETLERRFHYRRPGLWALGVRIQRRERAWRVPVSPAHAGCKSWVALDEPLSTAGLLPVVPERELERRLERLERAVRNGQARAEAGGSPRVG